MVRIANTSIPLMTANFAESDRDSAGMVAGCVKYYSSAVSFSNSTLLNIKLCERLIQPCKSARNVRTSLGGAGAAQIATLFIKWVKTPSVGRNNQIKAG